MARTSGHAPRQAPDQVELDRCRESGARRMMGFGKVPHRLMSRCVYLEDAWMLVENDKGEHYAIVTLGQVGDYDWNAWAATPGTWTEDLGGERSPRLALVRD